MFYCMFYFTCDRSFNTARHHAYDTTHGRGTPAVDITAMTSSGHVTSSGTSPFDSACPLSCMLPVVNNSISAV